MEVNLDGANIVVLAQTNNPTIASRDWLISRGIFAEEDFAGFEDKFTHTPVFARYETRLFVLFVDEGRLQVIAKDMSADVLGVLPEKVRAYVTHLPETPYTALGNNFRFAAEFPGRDEREAFLAECFRGKRLDGVERAAGAALQCSGAVLYRAEGAQVRVVVEPHRAKPEQALFDLNFHHDAPGCDRVTEALEKWETCRERAQGLVAAFFEG